MIHPKVAAGGVGGSIGGASAILVLWLMQGLGVPPEQFTPERVVALTTIMSVVTGFISGYAKADGNEKVKGGK